MREFLLNLSKDLQDPTKVSAGIKTDNNKLKF